MWIHTGKKPYGCCYDNDIENKSSLKASYMDRDIDNEIEIKSVFPFSSHLTKKICNDKNKVIICSIATCFANIFY